MNIPDNLVWVKSSRSAANGQCLEVRSGPVLAFTESEWLAFVAGAQAGEFDLPPG